MTMENLSIAIAIVIFIYLISHFFLLSEFIRPTLEKYGVPNEYHFMPSKQLEQIQIFLNICKKYNIHPYVSIYIKFLFVFTAVSVATIAIAMLSKV